MQTTLEIDAVGLLAGLLRLNYSPAEAICEVVDNAIDAGAANVHIFLRSREYLIIDDGKGMDEAGIQNALTLGASDADYAPRSLSKFGLGLKSTAFSQGDELDVISSPGSGAPFRKFRVSLPSIRDEYFATQLDLSDDDRNLLSQYLPGGRGTLVRIGQVRKEGHPAVSETQDLLEKRVGVIYYYFLQDGSLTLRLEGKPIKAFDVLFTDEANANGNLDDTAWNGRETRWILRRKPMLLDSEFGVRCEIEATQLPHPPSFNTPTEPDGASKVRKEYAIGAKNYGFYIYRNKRLISWADSLDGLFGYDQDLYSFRGRILLDDTADNAFHIDVKKTVFIWSEQALEMLRGPAQDYKRQSRRAWERAKQLVDAAKDSDPYKQANKLAEDLKPAAAPPGTPPLPPDREAAINEEIARKSQVQQREQAEQAEALREALQGVGAAPIDEQQEEEQETVSFATKIKRVATLQGDQLYQPQYDAGDEYFVFINRFHRFAKLLIDDNERNPDLQLIVELFIYQLAVAEVQFRRNFEGLFPHLRLNDDKVLAIMTEFRRYVASNLSTMCMQLDDKLPRTE